MILAAVLLPACGSAAVEGTTSGNVGAVDGDSQTQETESSPDTTESGNNEGATETPSGEDPSIEYESPLQKFLGFDIANFDSEEFEAEFVEEQRNIQESISVCMRELGWEYQPNTINTGFGFTAAAAEDGLERGSAEWVAKYGFGITTQAFPQSQVGLGLVGYSDPPTESSSAVSANQEYVEALSDGEREAYNNDLYGVGLDVDETASDEEVQEALLNLEPSGCLPIATAAGNDDSGQNFFQEFGDELAEMYERVDADPRVVSEQQDIVDCMSESGQTLSAGSSLFEQFFALFQGDLDALAQSQTRALEELIGDRDPELFTSEESAKIADALKLDSSETETLNRIQQQEVALASDMLTCDPNFFANEGRGDVFFNVLAEYEQEFLDVNAGELSEFEGSGK